MFRSRGSRGWANHALQKNSYVYVEAYKQAHVKEAIDGLLPLRYGQYAQEMVPVKNMPAIMRASKVAIKRAFARSRPPTHHIPPTRRGKGKG